MEISEKNWGVHKPKRKLKNPAFRTTLPSQKSTESPLSLIKPEGI